MPETLCLDNSYQTRIKRLKNVSKSQTTFKHNAYGNSGKSPPAFKETMDSKGEKVTGPRGLNTRQTALKMFRTVSKSPPNSTNYVNETTGNTLPASTETMDSNVLEFDENEQACGNLDGNDIEINRTLRYKALLKSSATMIGEISQMFGKLLDYSQNGKFHTLLNMPNINALKQGNALQN